MSDSTENQGAPRAGQRGEAAWKAEKERVAARNAQARRAGKIERQAQELGAAQARAAAHRREMDSLIEKPDVR